MAWKPAYITEDELKAHLRVYDDADDDAITSAVEAASRAIDFECGRQFGVEDEPVARTYTQDCGYWLVGRPALPVDDLSSAEDLSVDIDTTDAGTWPDPWTIDTDFTLWPPNAAADGKPYTHLLLRSTSAYYWPAYTGAVRVTGLFGWVAVPAVVKQACLIQAARFFVRRDASFGIAGSPEVGSEMRLLARLDPDVAVLLSSVKRHWGAV